MPESRRKKFNIGNLRFLKWIDADGNTHSKNLIEEICTKWEDMSNYLEFDDFVHLIKEKHNNDLIKCCRGLIVIWKRDSADKRYKYGWKGFCELLKDMEMSSLATEVSEVIDIEYDS